MGACRCVWDIQTYGGCIKHGGIQTYRGVQIYAHYIYIYQNNPINFVEIKFSSKIHVDTMKMEHSQSGSVCGWPNNILGYAAATLTIRCSLVLLAR